MELGSQLLSDMVVHAKYARYRADLGRRETYEEIVERNLAFHLERFPQMEAELREAYRQVFARRALPSMRSMQFAGDSLARNHARAYNCSFLNLDDVAAFSETMFLLLCGCGVGLSVQRRHVDRLPALTAPGRDLPWIVGDSVEGWAEAVGALMRAHLHGRPRPIFDFSAVRPDGSPLSSGGKAPGPLPLRRALAAVEGLLEALPRGSQLSPIQVYDIMCLLSECVLSGGIRRSAMICLFDRDDEEMWTAKSPQAMTEHPERCLANNSVVLPRGRVDAEEFAVVWERISGAGTGEPGILWTDDEDWGCNPCGEIALPSCGFCNLVEVNVGDVQDQADLERRVEAAAVIGTFQATLTEFPFLRPIWRRQAERDRLIGIGLTGIASGAVDGLDLARAARAARRANERTAARLGIAPAARLTCVKPSGTASLVLGCSSGIHPWHDRFYLRRMRLGVQEPLAVHLALRHPELIEPSESRPGREVVVTIPVAAPQGAATRHEPARDLLQRVRKVMQEWVLPGHARGANTNNISCTVTVREGEWQDVGAWVWRNRNLAGGLTFFPWYEGVYAQPPFESVSEEEFVRRSAALTRWDPADVMESADGTVLESQTACAGGSCEVVTL
ncbi:MAG: hypothetical protein MH204_06375 [Fimbriimonadaceae bacterium]|nr:hypothetical protein [Fimbriimonadaceae bacterium]